VKAIPVLEKLEAENPKDTWVAEWLAHCYLTRAQNESDADTRAQLTAHARDEANRAKLLGRNTESLNNLLEILSKKDPLVQHSENPAIAEWLRKGEVAFAAGDHKGALEAYAKALELDPKLYNAAVFSGDVYFREHDWDHAAEWFQRAIAINPDADTAYRYWADGMMEQKKLGEAKPLFIDAVVAQPYTKPPWIELHKWAKLSNFKIEHPRIQIPQVETGDLKVVDDDGSGRSVWTTYSTTRAAWPASVFARRFRNEKQYRHTLAEEAESLRATLHALNEKKIEPGRLDPSLAELARLEKAGFLEAWILLSHPDQGIAQDYPVYRKDHRAELRHYINDEILKPL